MILFAQLLASSSAPLLPDPRTRLKIGLQLRFLAPPSLLEKSNCSVKHCLAPIFHQKLNLKHFHVTKASTQGLSQKQWSSVIFIQAFCIWYDGALHVVDRDFVEEYFFVRPAITQIVFAKDYYKNDIKLWTHMITQSHDTSSRHQTSNQILHMPYKRDRKMNPNDNHL